MRRRETTSTPAARGEERKPRAAAAGQGDRPNRAPRQADRPRGEAPKGEKSFRTEGRADAGRSERPFRDAGPRAERKPREEARAAPVAKKRWNPEEAPPERKARGPGPGDAPLKRKPRPDAPRKPAASAASAAPHEKNFEGERVAKVMARAGACSRRDAEQWISEGRVAVNGRALTSPAFNVREGDQITVDGAPLAERERTRLFLFHKPAGLVTSAKDPEGRDTVFAYLEQKHPDLPRVVSVGRLDINTEGLLLLSNDGGLARTLELPATGWTRRYRVRVHGEVDQAQLDALAVGVHVEGVDYAPIEAKLDRVQGANAWITMTLSEGKNREVKRVLEHLGLAVNRLIRISFGPFQLGEIEEGAVEEVRLKVLREQLGKTIAEFAGVDFASPLREAPTPAEAQDKRKSLQNRPRKHVSTLRKQRDERMETGPRARIERAVTADRKGRAVAVERVVSKEAKPVPENRNARRFAAERRGDEPVRKERRFERPRPEGAREQDRDRGGERKFERAPRAGAGAQKFDGPRKPRGDAAAPGERRFDRPRPPPGDRTEGRRPPRAEGAGERGRERKFEGGPRRDGAAKKFDGPRKPRNEGSAQGERRAERPRQSDQARPPRPEGVRERGRERGAEGKTERAPRRDGAAKKFDGSRKPPGAGPARGGKPPSRGPRKPR